MRSLEGQAILSRQQRAQTPAPVVARVIPRVPLTDASLSIIENTPLKINPSVYPSFVPPAAPTQLKLRSILDVASLGTVQNGSLLLTNEAKLEIQKYQSAGAKIGSAPAQNIQSQEEDEEKQEAPADPRVKLLNKTQWLSCQTYPISVQLHLEKKFDGRPDLNKRLADVDGRRHGDGVWETAISGYRPFTLMGTVRDHWKNVILMNEEDPNFGDLGLFGLHSNGLSAVILLAAKAVGRTLNTEARQKFVLHFITLVCLQYWLLVRGRFMELSPDAPPSAEYRPPHLFYFHHATDFLSDQENNRKAATPSAKRKQQAENQSEEDDDDGAQSGSPRKFAKLLYRGSVKQEPRSSGAASSSRDRSSSQQQEIHDMAVGAAGRTNFLGFLNFVINQVKGIIEISRTNLAADSEFGVACTLMSFSDSIIHWCLDISTRHMQWFTCTRFKYHPVAEMVETINLRAGQSNRQLIASESSKFYPINKASAGAPKLIEILKETNIRNVTGVHTGCMPMFWSHNVFVPNAPLIRSEARLVNRPDGHTIDPFAAVHLALLARRLYFVAQKNHCELLNKTFIGGEILRFTYEDAEGQAVLNHEMTSKSFYTAFVEGVLDPNVSTLVQHRQHVARQKIALDPVLSPLVMRYNMSVEDNGIAEAFVPTIAGDMAAVALTDEADVESMTTTDWIRLSKVSAAHAPRLTSRDALIAACIIEEDRERCKRFIDSRFAKKNNTALTERGGLGTRYHKLDPSDHTNFLVYDGAQYDLTANERKQLLFVSRNTMVKPEFPLPPIQPSPRHLWSMLLKICKSEAQAVSSFIELQVKNDIDDAHRILLLLRLLADRSNGRKLDRSRFCEKWDGCHIPAALQRMHTSNVYADAQYAFFKEVDASWDASSPVRIPPGALHRLFASMFSDDIKRLDIRLIKEQSADVPKYRSLFRVGEGDDVELHAVVDIFTGELESAFGEGGLSEDAQWRSAKRCQLKNIPHLADGAFEGWTFSFLPNPRENHHLRMALREFNQEKQDREIAFSKLTLRSLLHFFVWYYSGFCESLYLHMAQLYPESACAKRISGDGTHDVSWVDDLRQTDALPMVTNLLLKQLNTLQNRALAVELAEASQMGIVPTERHQSMMLAAQLLLSAQVDSPFDDKRAETQQIIKQHMEYLLARCNAQPTSLNVLSQGGSGYLYYARNGFRDKAIKLLKRYVSLRRAFPVRIVQTLFDELVSTCDNEGDIPRIIEQVIMAVITDAIGYDNLPGYPHVSPIVTELMIWQTSKTDFLMKTVADSVLAHDSVREHRKRMMANTSQSRMTGAGAAAAARASVPVMFHRP